MSALQKSALHVRQSYIRELHLPRKSYLTRKIATGTRASNDVHHKQPNKFIAALIVVPAALFALLMLGAVSMYIAVSKLYWVDFLLGVLLGFAAAYVLHQFALEMVVGPLVSFGGLL